MGYKILFVLNALVNVALGAGLMFVPEMVLEQFRTQMRVPEIWFARCIGAALLTLGLMFWFAKDILDSKSQNSFGAVALLGSILALVVTIIGVLPSTGVIRNYGWIAIVVEVVFGLGYAFMLFLKPKMKE